MKHEIDLSKYKIRTDLVLEEIDKNKDISSIIYEENNIKITDCKVDENISDLINKKIGDYITIEFEDVTDSENRESVEKVFVKYLKDMLKRTNIKDNNTCLIIGLGNPKSTPDSLGPLVINNIIVTRHLFILGDVDDNFREVSAISPGVTGTTGIETSDLINSIVNNIKPDFIIVIDALASSSIERVNKTIQISNTGIQPGSGVGNSRKEISFDTLGIPVIAIGIPTVVDAVSVVSDTISFMHKHYAFNKKFINDPLSKLVSSSSINYLKKEVEIKNQDKTNLLGIVGSLNEFEVRELIYEVLSPIGYNLMVTPKEIDFIIEKLSDVISSGINKSLHKKIA